MKVIQWFKSHKPTKRRLVQLYAALLFNANLKGFGNGRIYRGNVKNLCTPGLNCYSCPGASGACPLGALQNAVSSGDKTIPYYIFGIILLYGFLFGRWICGFLCPFGLIQDLLHKIPTPKIKKGRMTRVLSYFKYVVLAVFCFIIPMLYLFRNLPLPGFCKYICPAGTFEGALGLLSNKVNESSLASLGFLFTWKFMLMVSFLVGAIFIYRIFCRFLCPLGALYSLFNKISMFGIKLERSKCIDCGECITTCKMDIKHVGDHECIGCGECISVCPTKAITFKGSKPMLAPNEIDAPTPEEAERIADEHNARILKRNKIVKICASVVMIAVLATALIYYNFIDKAPEPQKPNVTVSDDPDLPPAGNEVGTLCYGLELPKLNRESDTFSDTFRLEDTKGKITVLNFWYTSCTPCVNEMPHFAEIAEHYADDVVVIACHADMASKSQVVDYVEENWSSYQITYTYDSEDAYYTLLGGNYSWPMTLILDENNVIVAKYMGSVTYADLQKDVESILHK
ncbi:MAG: 4Fe-4S binding protein [Clostridia bacterium]|nr:4Fe-4S binding protein [Clostridia bacterium]MBQ9804940.1 4Fe-4S binding protein [Clostridia bacterium]